MDCNRIAPFYELFEHLSFGRTLERRRFAFLSKMRGAHEILECGGGDGRFIARLVDENTKARIDFVDLSSKMTELAKRRVFRTLPNDCKRIAFHNQDIRKFSPQQDCKGYDLIITHFFLDCFADLQTQEIVSRISGWAVPGAKWIVSEFNVPNERLRRMWTAGIVRSLYLAFGLTTGLQTTRLPDYGSALLKAGFQRESVEDACGGLLQSSLWRRAN
jgi:ubiquinone/menaquinone biosynthesis C-methylase UbiE